MLQLKLIWAILSHKWYGNRHDICMYKSLQIELIFDESVYTANTYKVLNSLRNTSKNTMNKTHIDEYSIQWM